jgi:hypothetical protein
MDTGVIVSALHVITAGPHATAFMAITITFASSVGTGNPIAPKVVIAESTGIAATITTETPAHEAFKSVFEVRELLCVGSISATWRGPA